MPDTPDADRGDAERAAAIRGLEEEFAVLLDHVRRLIAARAARIDPGLLPGAYKVFTTIVRQERTTLSALTESLVADKGQLSRTIRELEGLGLVTRTPDPHDRRSSVIEPTPQGLARLDAARSPSERLFLEAVEQWPVDDIRNLSRLLHALMATAAVVPRD